MKKILLTAALLVQSAVVFSQEEQAIQQWQSSNPTTQLISSERYATLSKDEKLLLGTDFILFEGSITLEQLENSEKAVKAPATINNAAFEDANTIKSWLGEHQEVKVIQHSEYVSMSETERAACQSKNFIVLSGEDLVVTDIYIYENK